jgi:ribonuclease P protein component
MPEQRTSRVGGEALSPEERLRKRAEFLRCYRDGRRRHGALVTLYIADPEGTGSRPRLGITVSRKVGGAVTRQRIKRRIREIYRRWSGRAQLPPCDLLFHVKPAAGQADFANLQAEIHRLLLPLTRPRTRDA